MSRHVRSGLVMSRYVPSGLVSSRLFHMYPFTKISYIPFAQLDPNQPAMIPMTIDTKKQAATITKPSLRVGSYTALIIIARSAPNVIHIQQIVVAKYFLILLSLSCLKTPLLVKLGSLALLFW